MRITSYGPGDEATWPPFAGHPNDPRYDDSRDIAIETLAAEMADNPFDVQDAIDRLPEDSWWPIAQALAKRDAQALLAAFEALLMPVMTRLAEEHLDELQEELP